MAPNDQVELRSCSSLHKEVQRRASLGQLESSNKQKANSMNDAAAAEEEGSSTILTQILGTVSIAISGSTIGTLIGFPGVTLPQLTDPNTDDLFLDTTQVALFGSLVSLGSMLGCFISTILLVQLGQRGTVLVTIPLMVAAWVWLSFATSVWMVQLVRFVIGMLMGLMCAAQHSYTAEIAHTSVRGRLVAVVDVLRQVGFLAICLIGLSSLTWRQMALTCGFITTIPCFILLCFMPDSPRWLASRGKNEAAAKALRFFRGKNYNYKKELETITNQLTEMTGSRLGTLQQLRQLMTPPIRSRVFNMSLLVFLSLFSGNFAIATYLVPVLKSANISIDPYYGAVLIGAVRVLGTSLAMFIADSTGRRFQLMTTWSFNATFLIILGSYFYVKDKTAIDVSHLGTIPLVFIVLLTIATTLGWPSLALIRTEVIPNSCRPVSAALFQGILFFATSITAALYPILVDVIGEFGLFWTYSITCMMFVALVYMTVPETKGQTLEAITELKHDDQKGYVNKAMETD